MSTNGIEHADLDAYAPTVAVELYRAVNDLLARTGRIPREAVLGMIEPPLNEVFDTSYTPYGEITEQLTALLVGRYDPTLFTQGLIQASTEWLYHLAETTSAYERPWYENPDAKYVYDRILAAPDLEALTTGAYKIDSSVGGISPRLFARWHQEGVESLEEMALVGAMYMQDIDRAVSQVVSPAHEESRGAISNFEEFEAYIRAGLSRFRQAIRGEIPDSDPVLRFRVVGRNIRELFRLARLQAGISAAEANALMRLEWGRFIISYPENRVLRWKSINEHDTGRLAVSDLELGVRAYVYEATLGGAGFGFPLYETITGDEPPDKYFHLVGFDLY